MTSGRRSSLAVERWSYGLAHVVGCSPGEIARKVEALLRFCARQRISPDGMIRRCARAPDRMERRRFYLGVVRDAGEKLTVQSFLIHNGVNVFGELVCMPDTAESVAREQGMARAPEKTERSHHRAS